MKNQVLKTSNWVYALLIGILGFSQGCSDSDDDEFMLEYGCPHADFVISGKVIDAANKPIKGIEVATPTANQKTDENGSYSLKYTTMPMQAIEITYKDIDGVENGGEFKEEAKSIALTDTDFVGGDSWYKGKVEKVIDAQLKIK
ncbi:MAG: radical SAM-associated putative lipoprotein [Rikenellaceae bacterium]